MVLFYLNSVISAPRHNYVYLWSNNFLILCSSLSVLRTLLSSFLPPSFSQKRSKPVLLPVLMFQSILYFGVLYTTTTPRFPWCLINVRQYNATSSCKSHHQEGLIIVARGGNIKAKWLMEAQKKSQHLAESLEQRKLDKSLFKCFDEILRTFVITSNLVLCSQTPQSQKDS